MNLDVNQLVDDLKSTATDVLNTDVTALRGFSERQLQAIAQQSQFIASGILTGQITSATQEFFLDNIEDMTLNFVKTLRGLLVITVEKVWNALVGVIWKAISAVTGIVLPGPVNP